VAALEQHRRRALGRGELDLGQDFIDGERPRLGIARLPIEGAELAVGDADVRVVGVRVDDERHALVGDAGEPNLLGEGPQLEEPGLGEEEPALVAIESLSVARLVGDAIEH